MEKKRKRKAGRAGKRDEVGGRRKTMDRKEGKEMNQSREVMKKKCGRNERLNM